jgi:hypothetical protein
MIRGSRHLSSLAVPDAMRISGPISVPARAQSTGMAIVHYVVIVAVRRARS